MAFPIRDGLMYCDGVPLAAIAAEHLAERIARDDLMTVDDDVEGDHGRFDAFDCLDDVGLIVFAGSHCDRRRERAACMKARRDYR